ncbi:hypothetical protein ACWDA3_56055 [Nonomuraea rubra]
MKWRFSAEGIHFGQDVRLVLSESPGLRDYTRRLADLPMQGGGRVGEARAWLAVSRLVVGSFILTTEESVGRFTAHLERIEGLRGELNKRYDLVHRLFAKSEPLAKVPDELLPGAIGRLFDELDRTLDELAKLKERQALRDAIPDVGDPEVRKGVIEPETRVSTEELGAEELRAEPASSVEPAPTLGLDPSPMDPGAPPMDPGGRVPEGEAYARYRPGEGRARGGQDRAALARYRELQARDLHTSEAERALVQQRVDLWAPAALPKDSKVTTVRVAGYSEGDLAALVRFKDLDPHIAGRGYELEITLPDGQRFRADGIRFADAEGRVYQFLESKEPYTWVPGESYYASESGQASLAAMLERDARIATELRGHGCAGFHYETGHPGLDAFLQSRIQSMMDDGVAGADLLFAGTGR